MARRRKRNPDEIDAEQVERELVALAGVLAWYPPGTQLHFGSPSRCPDCGDYGMIERVSHSAGVCANHCRVCRRDWVITLRAIRAERNASTQGSRALTSSTPGIGAFYQAVTQAAAAPTETITEPAPEPAPAPPVDTSVDLSVDPVAEAPTETEAAPAIEPAPIETAPRPAPPTVTTPAAVEPAVVVAPTPDLDLSTAPAQAASGPMRILVVEHNPFDMELLAELLEPFSERHEVVVTNVETRHDGELAADRGQFDLVLLALDLPDSTGLTTILEWQHRGAPHLPLIAITDEADANLIQEARLLGVAQILQRPHLEKLATQPGPGGQRLMKLLRKATRAPRTAGPAVARPSTHTVDAA